LKNEKKAKEDFDKRVFESKKQAIEKNIELAKKTGNVLTQTMDENGNLVGVKENVNFDDREVAEEGGDKIRAAALEKLNKKD
jgi:predicted chitinase